MKPDVYYDILDKDLEGIIEEYKEDDYFVKHRRHNENCKSRALLIWFLRFYGKTNEYRKYITDGAGDHSCDIIFNSIDNQGSNVFYLVQSKWNTKNNISSEVDKAEVLQALTEFDDLLNGHDLSSENEIFKRNVEALQNHIKENGEVKVIYLTLCKPNDDTKDNIKAFLQKNKKTAFEWIDLDRLKFDYIDREFKSIEPINPLNKYYNPEDEQIKLFIKTNGQGRSFIHIEKPFEAYVFLLKPSTIFNLFEKYGFLLFQKNVRNPLMTSVLNEQIEKTIIDNPAYFWYYNNGLTAITYILPEIRDGAESINVTGLQIINGAQTVYSIYQAYKEATPVKRQIMDSESFVTLRILKSGGRDFDLNVTRFTNSQNPVSDRDFVANDDIQTRLQKESFNTLYWYEKRRGEFRDSNIENIEIISNEILSKLYTAYYLHDPVKANAAFGKKHKYAFISRRDNEKGLYETIFNEETRFEDMLAAFHLQTIIFAIYEESCFLISENLIILSVYSFVAKEYFKMIYEKDFNNLSKEINKRFDNGSIDILIKITKYIHDYLEKFDNNIPDDQPHDGGDFLLNKFRLISSVGYFERLKEELINSKIERCTIEQIDVESEMKQFNSKRHESNFLEKMNKLVSVFWL